LAEKSGYQSFIGPGGGRTEAEHRVRAGDRTIGFDIGAYENFLEFYNAFNHTQFHDVNTSFGQTNFGQVVDTYDPRVIELLPRFKFCGRKRSSA